MRIKIIRVNFNYFKCNLSIFYNSRNIVYNFAIVRRVDKR